MIVLVVHKAYIPCNEPTAVLGLIFTWTEEIPSFGWKARPTKFGGTDLIIIKCQMLWMQKHYQTQQKCIKNKSVKWYNRLATLKM